MSNKYRIQQKKISNLTEVVNFLYGSTQSLLKSVKTINQRIDDSNTGNKIRLEGQHKEDDAINTKITLLTESVDLRFEAHCKDLELWIKKLNFIEKYLGVTPRSTLPPLEISDGEPGEDEPDNSEIEQLKKDLEQEKLLSGYLAIEALCALSGARVGTPEKGYLKEPGCLRGDIRRLANERDIAKRNNEILLTQLQSARDQRDRARAELQKHGLPIE